jgi:hypothetical protein
VDLHELPPDIAKRLLGKFHLRGKQQDAARYALEEVRTAGAAAAA